MGLEWPAATFMNQLVDRSVPDWVPTKIRCFDTGGRRRDGSPALCTCCNTLSGIRTILFLSSCQPHWPRKSSPNWGVSCFVYSLHSISLRTRSGYGFHSTHYYQAACRPLIKPLLTPSTVICHLKTGPRTPHHYEYCDAVSIVVSTAISGVLLAIFTPNDAVGVIHFWIDLGYSAEVYATITDQQVKYMHFRIRQALTLPLDLRFEARRRATQ